MNNWNINILEYEFFSPEYFWLLLLLPVYFLILYIQNRRKTADVYSSQLKENNEQKSSYFILIIKSIISLLTLSLFLLVVVVLAKPFKWSDFEDIYGDYDLGIDIVLAVDVSLSMQSKDFEPNRLAAAKRVMNTFIDDRKGDRIGIVAYAGEAYSVCSPTTNYNLLKSRIEYLHGNNIEQGTAIGLGLGTSVLQLQRDSLSSKVVILLTDGMNNTGELSPLAAAELAKQNNICVYTIGVGSNGEALSPVSTNFGIRYGYQKVEIDEETLKEIAKTTNGKYFRATDENSLNAIYSEINALEKQKMDSENNDRISPTTPIPFLNTLILCFIGLFLCRFYFFPFKYD